MTARCDIHLVRHGQSTWNAARRVQGQAAHVSLTPLGERQASRAAGRLAGCGARTVYSSDLLRAVQTAQPIADRLGVAVTVDPDLRERGMGSFEGWSSAAALAAAGADWADPAWRPPGGESIRDVCVRVRRFLARLRAEAGGTAVVVTHGDAVRIAVGLLRGFPADSLPWTELANGDVITVSY